MLRDISSIPQGTFIVKPRQVLNVVNNIMNNNDPAEYFDKRRVIAELKKSVENGDDAEIKTQHVCDIRNMINY